MAKRAIARPVRIEWPDPSVMKKGTKRTKRKKMTTNWLENDFRMVKTSNFFACGAYLHQRQILISEIENARKW